MGMKARRLRIGGSARGLIIRGLLSDAGRRLVRYEIIADPIRVISKLMFVKID